MKKYEIKVAWNGYLLEFVPNQGSVFKESYAARTYVFAKFEDLTAFIKKDLDGNLPGPEPFERDPKKCPGDIVTGEERDNLVKHFLSKLEARPKNET